MTNTYNDVYTKANSKDCSVQEFRDILWQYVEDEMIKVLKSGNVDIKLIKTLVNYRGNRACMRISAGLFLIMLMSTRILAKTPIIVVALKITWLLI